MQKQPHDIYKVLPYWVDFKAPGEFEIHWVRKYLMDVVSIEIKDL